MIDALPLQPGVRVLEIGGAPGAAARVIADIVGPAGHVLVLDRSARGIALTRSRCAEQIASGVLSTLEEDVEGFVLPDGVEPFDVAFACRVGVLDGRHPEMYRAALAHIADALKPSGRLFVDTGSPLVEVPLRKK